MLTGKTDIVRTQLDTAVALLEQAAKLDPIDANVWAEWALIDRRYVDEYIDRSPARFDLARRHATQATGLDPASRVARCAQAATMVLLNSDEATKQAAITTLETLANEGTEYPDVLYLLATLKHEPERPEATFGYLERAARFPNWAGRAHFGRAAAYFRARQFQRAEDALDQALQIERAAKFLLWKCYLLAIWQGDMVASKRVIEEVPAQMFGEDYAASARWFVELWSRDYDRALAAMRALPRDFMESSALSGPTGYYKGVALAHAGKTAAAEIEWRSALEVVGRRLNAQPNDRMLLQFKARLLAALGDRAEGEKLWRSTRELFGTEAQSWDDYFISMEFLSDDSAIEQLIDHSKNALPFALAANLRLDPFLDRLRSHPKFVELLATAEADPRLSPKAQTAAKTGNPSGAVRVAEKSIAVLPFVNLGADKGDEYLGDGLTEELLSALSQIKALRVPGRSSCFAFKGKTGEDLYRQIGEKLQVRTVLEGTVRKVGEKLRITAQLINVGDGSILWSKPYDGDMKDFLAVQTEVAQRVVEALVVHLGGEEARSLAKKATDDPEAHRLYLLGRYHFAKFTEFGFAAAEQHFTAAIRLDPNYAHAYCGLADNFGFAGGIMLSGRVAWAKQREFAQKALAIDPSLAEAHFSLGLALAATFEWGAAQLEMRRALELNPNLALARDQYAWLLVSLGRSDEAIAEARRALESDPLSPLINCDLAAWLYMARRYDQALAQVRKTLELEPNYAMGYAMLGLCLLAKGDRPGAIVALLKAKSLDANPWFDGWLGYAYAANADRVKAGQVLREVEQQAEKRYVSPSVRMWIYLGLGETAKALDWLEKCYDEQDSACPWMKVFPLFDSVRGEPRFEALLKKVRLDK